MEEALIEVPTMRRFAGIDLISDRISDDTTILTFRHLLKKHGLCEQIFQIVNPAGSSYCKATRRLCTAMPATRVSARDWQWQIRQLNSGWR